MEVILVQCVTMRLSLNHQIKPLVKGETVKLYLLSKPFLTPSFEHPSFLACLLVSKLPSEHPSVLSFYLHIVHSKFPYLPFKLPSKLLQSFLAFLLSFYPPNFFCLKFPSKHPFFWASFQMSSELPQLPTELPFLQISFLSKDSFEASFLMSFLPYFFRASSTSYWASL